MQIVKKLFLKCFFRETRCKNYQPQKNEPKNLISSTLHAINQFISEKNTGKVLPRNGLEKVQRERFHLKMRKTNSSFLKSYKKIIITNLIFAKM